VANLSEYQKQFSLSKSNIHQFSPIYKLINIDFTLYIRISMITLKFGGLMKNLLDPAILFFVFGCFAGLIRSNLEIPRSIAKFL
jgi:hypothetical protein